MKLLDLGHPPEWKLIGTEGRRQRRMTKWKRTEIFGEHREQHLTAYAWQTLKAGKASRSYNNPENPAWIANLQDTELLGAVAKYLMAHEPAIRGVINLTGAHFLSSIAFCLEGRDDGCTLNNCRLSNS